MGNSLIEENSSKLFHLKGTHSVTLIIKIDANMNYKLLINKQLPKRNLGCVKHHIVKIWSNLNQQEFTALVHLTPLRGSKCI